MHGITAGEVAGPGDVEAVCAVFRLDEDEPRAESWLAELRLEVLEVREAPLERIQVHAAQRGADGEVVSFEDPPVDAVVIEQIEDVAVLEPVALDRGRGDDVG